MRCTKCKIKLKFSENIPCKCNNLYCNKHKLSVYHNCMFDYKNENMLKLKNEMKPLNIEKLTPI